MLLIPLLLLGGCNASNDVQSGDGPLSTGTGTGTAGTLAALALGVEGYDQALPATRLRFPEDHAAHDGFRIEWWYLTANLQDASGQPYGAQWTLFRIARQPPAPTRKDANPWQSAQVYMAHFAITTPDSHHAFQRYARGGSHGGRRRAGANASPFAVWLDDWELSSTTDAAGASAKLDANTSWLPLQLHARERNFGIKLSLNSDRPLILQGEQGFSRKHVNGAGSHYYSHPYLRAEGEIEVGGEVVPVSGEAWLDREWSSQFLQPDQQGWDWFALHLDSGEKLMLFQLRSKPNSGERTPFRHGVLLSAQGERRELQPSKLRLTPLEHARVAGRDIPVVWQLDLEELDRSLTVRALHPDQWMNVDFAYWEGYVNIEGGSAGERGRGYLEMVGYEFAD